MAESENNGDNVVDMFDYIVDRLEAAIDAGAEIDTDLLREIVEKR